jgi:ribosomal 50S subunit-recycling heat shock protein
MFLESSRYYKQRTVDTVVKGGRIVKVLTQRRLTAVNGKATVIKGNDRLDIISQRQYKNSAMFWHIADANTELEANNLVKKTGRTIIVPEQ